jgi:hypothetical protein
MNESQASDHPQPRNQAIYISKPNRGGKAPVHPSTSVSTNELQSTRTSTNAVERAVEGGREGPCRPACMHVLGAFRIRGNSSDWRARTARARATNKCQQVHTHTHIRRHGARTRQRAGGGEGRWRRPACLREVPVDVGGVFIAFEVLAVDEMFNALLDDLGVGLEEV